MVEGCSSYKRTSWTFTDDSHMTYMITKQSAWSFCDLHASLCIGSWSSDETSVWWRRQDHVSAWVSDKATISQGFPEEDRQKDFPKPFQFGACNSNLWPFVAAVPSPEVREWAAREEGTSIGVRSPGGRARRVKANTITGGEFKNLLKMASETWYSVTFYFRSPRNRCTTLLSWILGRKFEGKAHAYMKEICAVSWGQNACHFMPSVTSSHNAVSCPGKAPRSALRSDWWETVSFNGNLISA